MNNIMLTRHSSTLLPLLLAAILPIAGCHSTSTPANQPQPDQQQGQQQPVPNQPGQQAVNPGATPVQRPYPQGGQQQGYAPPPQQRAPSVIPAGTHLVVSLGQEISSKTSQAGDSFSATVVEPVVVKGVTLVRAGSPATGTVVDSKSAGKFKGQGTLALRLDSVRAEGHSYEVASTTVERVEKGKGKRTAALTGGGGGLGALIGGIAGGGKGALIGGLAGAGAGVTGSALTGNHELVIPAETQLTFRIERDVSLR